jgi:hypothetical protein
MSSDQLSPLIADLHLLTVLAATRSFTETARRLGLSKASASTVSRCRSAISGDNWSEDIKGLHCSEI